MGTTKRSWPLVGLAVTSFIPGFGFLLGAIAVTWGLLSDRPRARLAVWLGLSGAVLNLLAGFAVTYWLHKSPEMQQAQAAGAANDLTQLVTELDAYRATTGAYPNSLQTLVGYPIPRRLLNIHDQTAGLFVQRYYTYRVASDGRSFDLFAVGPDGQPDTSDDIRPALPDSLQAASGYRPAE